MTSAQVGRRDGARGIFGRLLQELGERRNDPALPLTIPTYRFGRLLPTQNVLKFHLLGSSARPLVSDLRL